MTDERIAAAMAMIDQAPTVEVGGGKQYTMVQERVVAFRTHFGLEYGIGTILLKDDGKTIQVQANITDPNGNVIGSGLAEEVRGSNPVNKVSALENTETSAIGRALANLGLHGGEYASANEMDKVKRMSKQEPPPEKKADPPPEKKADPPPDPALRSFTSEEIAAHIVGMDKHRDIVEHRTWGDTYRKVLDHMEKNNPAQWQVLLNKYEERKLVLTNKEGK